MSYWDLQLRAGAYPCFLGAQLKSRLRVLLTTYLRISLKPGWDIFIKGIKRESEIQEVSQFLKRRVTTKGKVISMMAR
jgi:hypothetical protein